MKQLPYTQKAFDLLHQSTVALSRVEARGIRMDTAYLNSTIKTVQERIDRMEERLLDSKVARVWKKRVGSKFKLDSLQQLGVTLFQDLGHVSTEQTETGLPKMDEQTLSTIDDPFVKLYFKCKKLKKARTTYLMGIQREIVDGILHPVFNLHLVVTYRSSSDSPNFQNIPIRNLSIGKMIRKAFIARRGRRLVELDYSGVEVRVAACYHKDPVMIEYIKDPTKDMHRDMAGECFCVPPNMVSKEMRYCGKNMFVFPQFYGDWYIDCARHLWEAVDKMDLKLVDGTPLREHLNRKGIRERGELIPGNDPTRGSFEAHIRATEHDFWKRRFKVYDRWRQQWYDAYKGQGWFQTKSGFVVQGYMKRNEVINSPVQGTAFHLLLWSLKELVLKELRKHKMRTYIIGQIHDSIVADVPEEEFEDFLVLANNVMTQQVRKWAPWLTVPLEVEAEASPVNGNWAEKEAVEIPT